MSKPMTATETKAAFKKWGVNAFYLPGWETRGRPASTAGGPFEPNGIMIHHTGSDRQDQDYIDWLFKQGRPAEGIPAPLANVMSMMNGHLMVGAIGKANHAGSGSKAIFDKVLHETISMTEEEVPGPSTENGNDDFYGDEVAFDGGQPMTAAQYETTVRWCAAVCDFHGWTAQSIIGHGEWTKAKWDPGKTDMAKLRRDVAALLKAGPPSAPKPDPEPESKPELSRPHTYISGNLAAYNKPYGEKTAESRARGVIPDYLLPKRPEWFHFQECSKSMLDEIDKEFKGYIRVAAGGKGRESLYRKDAGLTIIAAELQNVKHMWRKDTKEFLLIAYHDNAGYEGVYANFHNENEGSSVQILQINDVKNAALAFAKKHGIDYRNVVLTGDSNSPKVRAWAKSIRTWREARDIARKQVDLTYKTTNGWKAWNRGGLVKGVAIDVDVFRVGAVVDRVEMLFGLIADHWAHSVIHRLYK